jgi:hypothetical protein
MSPGRAGLALLACALAFPVRPAQAQPDTLVLETADCPDLRLSELQRLLHLELGAVSQGEVPSLHVSLRCTAEGLLQIGIDDPVGRRRLDRTVPAPAMDAPGRERTIALVTTQLLYGTWRDLFVPRIAAPPRPARPRPPLPPRAPRWSFGLEGGASLRHLADPVVLPELGGRLGARLGQQWSASLVAAVQWTKVSRQAGDVRTLLPLVRVALEPRFTLLRGLALGPSIALSGGFLRLSGTPSGPTYAGATRTGLLGEIGGGFALWIRIGAAELSFFFGAGLARTTLVGAVSDGPEVDLQGPSMQAGATASLWP